MADTAKRLYKMAKDLENIAGLFDDLEFETNKRFYRDAPDYYYKNIATIALIEDQLSKDILKMWSVIRGYQQEINIAVKQVKKNRQIANDSTMLKRADVASYGGGTRRFFQLKVHSSASSSGVDDLIGTALFQLFGGGREIPKPGSKLIARIRISSGKCAWPFEKLPTPWASSQQLMREVTQKVAPKAKYQLEKAILAKNDWLEKESKKELNKQNPEIQAAYRLFFNNLCTCEVKVVVEYDKQLRIGHIYIPRLLDNTSWISLDKVSLTFTIRSDGTVQIEKVYLNKKRDGAEYQITEDDLKACEARFKKAVKSMHTRQSKKRKLQ